MDMHKRMRWEESPCSSCPDSPCCTHLPLYKVEISTLWELHYLLFVLSFQGIEAGLYDTGTWVIYYKGTCVFLQNETSMCSIHATERQPRVCRDYSPTDCFYKKAYSSEGSGRFLRFNKSRLQALLPMTEFSEEGDIVRTPEWEVIEERIKRIPLEAPPLKIRASSGNLAERVSWKEKKAAKKVPEIQCSHLFFPVPDPTSIKRIEFMRFRLGFPGVSAVTAGDRWYLKVHTPCRFLSNGLCSIYPFPCLDLVKNGERHPLPFRWPLPEGTGLHTWKEYNLKSFEELYSPDKGGLLTGKGGNIYTASKRGVNGDESCRL